MKYYLFLLLSLATFFIDGCTEDHHIIVEKNGSAIVSYNLHLAENDSTAKVKSDTADLAATKDSLHRIFNSFYASPLISNYECKISNELEVVIIYKISDVNQLGRFLSPFLCIPITCKSNKKTFTIDAGTGNANPEDDIGGYTNMLAFKLTIELPGKIKKVENSSGLSVSYSGNQFTMESNIGALNYSGKRNLVVINY